MGTMTTITKASHDSEPYADDEDNIIWRNSSRKLHRLDGPALEWADGTKVWWVNGKRHRLDGPALEWADGSKEWYVDGKLHRLDGPAIEHANGSKSWRVDGKHVPVQNQQDFEYWLLGIKI